jgi:2-hydroxychromene-2-carboxylate isomerase
LIVYHREQFVHFSEQSLESQMPHVTFYFDLGSPYAYLAAERLPGLLAEPVEWQPLSLGGLFKLTGRSSWALAGAERRQAGMAEIELRARAYGLPPIRWPDPWPGNYLMAMRAATFAFARGFGREFTMCAFRDAFQSGRDLSIPAHVLEVAERVGLDRREVAAATQADQVKQTLRRATEAAHELGVIGVPTIAIDAEPFWGDDRVEDAAAHLKADPERGS